MTMAVFCRDFSVIEVCVAWSHVGEIGMEVLTFTCKMQSSMTSAKAIRQFRSLDNEVMSVLFDNKVEVQMHILHDTIVIGNIYSNYCLLGPSRACHATHIRFHFGTVALPALTLYPGDCSSRPICM